MKFKSLIAAGLLAVSGGAFAASPYFTGGNTSIDRFTNDSNNVVWFNPKTGTELAVNARFTGGYKNIDSGFDLTGDAPYVGGAAEVVVNDNFSVGFAGSSVDFLASDLLPANVAELKVAEELALDLDLSAEEVASAINSSVAVPSALLTFYMNYGQSVWASSTGEFRYDAGVFYNWFDTSNNSTDLDLDNWGGYVTGRYDWNSNVNPAFSLGLKYEDDKFGLLGNTLSVPVEVSIAPDALNGAVIAARYNYTDPSDAESFNTYGVEVSGFITRGQNGGGVNLALGWADADNKDDFTSDFFGNALVDNTFYGSVSLVW